MNDPQASEHLKPGDVPVFSCIVYVSRTEGGVRARAANLPELECTAASEREALAKVVAAFKQRVGELLRSGAAIPWVEPPAAAEAGEQRRLLAVHL
ncbi:MAG TPA: hypothetical protein VIK18_07400 [Pirellulales bacterium]